MTLREGLRALMDEWIKRGLQSNNDYSEGVKDCYQLCRRDVDALLSTADSEQREPDDRLRIAWGFLRGAWEWLDKQPGHGSRQNADQIEAYLERAGAIDTQPSAEQQEVAWQEQIEDAERRAEKAEADREALVEALMEALEKAAESMHKAHWKEGRRE